MGPLTFCFLRETKSSLSSSILPMCSSRKSAASIASFVGWLGFSSSCAFKAYFPISSCMYFASSSRSSSHFLVSVVSPGFDGSSAWLIEPRNFSGGLSESGSISLASFAIDF